MTLLRAVDHVCQIKADQVDGGGQINMDYHRRLQTIENAALAAPNILSKVKKDKS